MSTTAVVHRIPPRLLLGNASRSTVRGRSKYRMVTTATAQLTDVQVKDIRPGDNTVFSVNEPELPPRSKMTLGGSVPYYCWRDAP